MVDIIHREFIYIWYYASVQTQLIARYWIFGMIAGSFISVFAKRYILSLFLSLQEKRLGILGVFPASILGIISPLCMYGTIPIAATFSENGGIEIPVEGGIRLETNQVGASFNEYDFFVILSHFKGHAMGGFGGALKNMSIGIASSEGKSLIHTGGEETSGIGFNTPVDIFTESMAEAAKSISDYLDNGESIIYINVMNNISVDCDCVANPAEPDMHDIGIFASLDPVALDQACVDFVYASPDGESVIERIESRNGVHILEHSVEIGFGSREYQLLRIY